MASLPSNSPTPLDASGDLYKPTGLAFTESRAESYRDIECGRRIPILENMYGPSRIINGKEVKPAYKFPWIVKSKARANVALFLSNDSFLVPLCKMFTDRSLTHRVFGYPPMGLLATYIPISELDWCNPMKA
ncbi:hypothetical protein TNCV_1980401 [Trichonephila clavipes]|nr:hypothetical protein TNCV_1980401 [Trichonephila clavipes]